MRVKTGAGRLFRSEVVLVYHLSRIATFVLLVFLLAACGTSGSDSNGDFRSGGIAGNSSATLTGDQLGTGTASVSLLRKVVSVTLQDDHPQLTVGTAYLTRTHTSTEYASLLLSVTNSGSRALCFVWANDLDYREGSVVITSSSTALVEGSVGMTASGNFTSSCLGAGETGTFIDIVAPPSGGQLWSVVDAVTIASLSASETTVSSHGGRLLPTSYGVDGSGALSTVIGKNEGSIVLYPGEFSVYILLDDAGAPLEWSYLEPPSNSSLATDTSATWTPLTASYAGSASGLHVHFDYSGNAPTSSTSVQQTSRPSRIEFLQLREDRAQMLVDGVR